MDSIIRTVEQIEEGMCVDLESCPYLHDHPTAQFEYALVVEAYLETPECIVISYEGIDSVGYPVGTQLLVQSASLRRIGQ
jgi:hypothetical protein